MKPILALLIVAPLMGQVYPGPLPIEMSSGGKGLVRKGLVAGYDLKSVNLLKWSEPQLITNIVVRSATISITETTEVGISKWVQFPEANQLDYAYPAVTLINGVGYTFSAYVVMDAGGAPVVGNAVDSGNASIDFLINIGGALIDPESVTLVSGNVYKVLAHYSWSSYASAWCGIVRYGANSGRGFKVSGFQINEGPTALPYVATTDLQTVPNMVAGGAALQLGSTSGVDTNDPTRGLVGMVFDGVDDYGTGPTQAMSPTSFSISSVFNIASASMLNIVNYGYAPRFSARGDGAAKPGYWSGDFGETRALTSATWYDHGIFGGTTASGSILNGSVYYTTALATSGSTNAMELGKSAGSAGYFNGTISYVLIYNRALTPKEVRQNHNWLKAQMAQVGVSLP